MNLAKLNPFVRSAALYEVTSRTDACIAYDARIIYMVSGALQISIADEKKQNINVGNLVYIPAGVKYKLKGDYFRAVVVTFDPVDTRCDITDPILPASPENFDEKGLLADDLTPFNKVIKIEDMESERESFVRMANIATSAEGEWRAQVSAMLKLILLKIAENVSENALPTRMVESLDTYIRENCSDEISNTEIGAIFGYHPFYVSKVLKDKKGITLRQYIIAYRLKAARALLRYTKKSIAEIAEETGFTDASYFTKTFRQTFGITPKEYRNEFKDNFI